jgi:hypothetical protein
MRVLPKTKHEWQRLLLVTAIGPLAALVFARRFALMHFGATEPFSPDRIQAWRIMNAIQTDSLAVTLLVSAGITFAICTAFLFMNRRLGVIGFGLLFLFGCIHWTTLYIYLG